MSSGRCFTVVEMHRRELASYEACSELCAVRWAREPCSRAHPECVVLDFTSLLLFAQAGN